MAQMILGFVEITQCELRLFTAYTKKNLTAKTVKLIDSFYD